MGTPCSRSSSLVRLFWVTGLHPLLILSTLSEKYSKKRSAAFLLPTTLPSLKIFTSVLPFLASLPNSFHMLVFPSSRSAHFFNIRGVTPHLSSDLDALDSLMTCLLFLLS